jgi:hypothetical protein
MIILYVFLLIAIIKLVINAQKFIATKRYKDMYLRWLAGETNRIFEHKARVVTLWKDAGVSDGTIGNAQPVGYGKVMTGSASVMENFPNPRADMHEITMRIFYEAIGVYRSRMVETINPVYWLEAIINLPKHAFAYLGASPESVVTKIFQLVWWCVGAVAALLFAIYKTQTEGAIKDYIDRWLGA